MDYITIDITLIHFNKKKEESIYLYYIVIIVTFLIYYLGVVNKNTKVIQKTTNNMKINILCDS